MDIAVSIGNTRSAVARMDQHKIYCVRTCATWGLRGMLETFGGKEHVSRVFYASVVPSAETAVRGVFGRKARKITWKDIPLKLKIERPEKAGIDRLLNATAAWSGFRSPCLIVDAGSAITLDLVNRKGEFEGGVIFPGYRLLAGSLHQLAQLKNFMICDSTPLVGRNTSEAVSSGILNGIVFLVSGYFNRLSEKYPGLYLIFTGGDGDKLRKKVKTGLYRENLTMEGIRIVVYEGVKSIG